MVKNCIFYQPECQSEANCPSVSTCIRRQVEVKDGDDGDEDAGDDDVQDVVQRLPLDDQVEAHVLIVVVVHVLSARLVPDVPLAALW